MLELGCNHQGDINIAKEMIDDAKLLGVNGVKLQKRCNDTLPTAIKEKKRDPASSFGLTYYAHRQALEFTIEQVVELKKHAEDQGLFFAESVFDVESLDAMIDIGVTHIKLPSQFLLNRALNYRLKIRGGCVTTMHSTGMHTVQEVIDCPWLDNFDITMYCRSIYPHGLYETDFGSAVAIYSELGDWEKCGYSSHDKDGDLIPYYVMFGATFIERHYTLDKNLKGSDHRTVSSDFKEMQHILRDIAEVEEQITPKNWNHLVHPEEIANREFYVR
jgi:sialic acid synthase SpsE